MLCNSDALIQAAAGSRIGLDAGVSGVSYGAEAVTRK